MRKKIGNPSVLINLYLYFLCSFFCSAIHAGCPEDLAQLKGDFARFMGRRYQAVDLIHLVWLRSGISLVHFQPKETSFHAFLNCFSYLGRAQLLQLMDEAKKQFPGAATEAESISVRLRQHPGIQEVKLSERSNEDTSKAIELMRRFSEELGRRFSGNWDYIWAVAGLSADQMPASATSSFDFFRQAFQILTKEQKISLLKTAKELFPGATVLDEIQTELKNL